MENTTLTKENVKKAATALKPEVETYLKAKAIAEVERERVDKIHRKVLDELGHTEVEDKDTYYKLSDEESAVYYAKLNEIHLAEGFEDAAKGFCPALVAETVEREARIVLVDASKEYTGLGYDEVSGNMERLEKYTKLIVGLVVNAPKN